MTLPTDPRAPEIDEQPKAEPRPRPDRPNTPDPRRFFVVWSPQGGPPVVRIASFDAARGIASNLARKHPDQDFFVLQSCWGRRATVVHVAVAPAVEGQSPEAAEPLDPD